LKQPDKHRILPGVSPTKNIVFRPWVCYNKIYLKYGGI
jgi:hypothetical protein